MTPNVQEAKMCNCLPCLRPDTLETIPYSAACTYLGQVRESPSLRVGRSTFSHFELNHPRALQVPQVRNLR